MLTPEDVAEIKATRAEIEANRRETITIYHAGTKVKDPITGEEITGEPTPEDVEVVWKKFTLADKAKFAGTDVEEGEASVTFHLDVILDDLTDIKRNGISYTLMTIDERGLGGINRRECVVRRSV